MTLELRVTKRSICSAGSGADWSDAFDLCSQKGRIHHTGEVHLHPQVSVRTGELPPFVPEGPEVADQVVDGVTVEAVGVHGNVVLTARKRQVRTVRQVTMLRRQYRMSTASSKIVRLGELPVPR